MDRFDSLLAAAEEQDPAGLAEVIALEIPAAVRATPAGWAYLRQRVEQIVHFGLDVGLADLPGQAPLSDSLAVTALRAVSAEVLVIGCHGDEVHLPSVAVALAAAMPGSVLHLYDAPGVLWTERADVRERIAAFLNG
jgi:hypothetical protein